MWYGPLFGCININLGGKAVKQNKLASMKNQITFQNVFARLVKKGLSRYEIEGLPDTCSERVVKMSLLYHGSVGFFEKEGSVLALPAAPGSGITLNGDFTKMWVYGRNGFNEEIPLYIPGGENSKTVAQASTGIKVTSEKRGVWVRENEIVYPFLNYCIDYADKISDTMRTLDIARFYLKRPGIFVAEEQAVASLKKFFDSMENNQPYDIVSTGIYDVTKVNLLQIEQNPDNVKGCTDLIEWYMNDFDNLCFKNSNSNPDKKERLLVDEVNSNNESTDAQGNSFLEYLQEQFDFVNECLGTNITVKLNKEDKEDDDIRGMDRDSAIDELGGSGSSDSRSDN